MPFFRMRLILALIVGITLVSIGSTYFDVLAHKHALRRELVRRSQWLGASLQPQIEQAAATGSEDRIASAVQHLHRGDQALGIAVFNPGGRLLASAGGDEVLRVLAPDAVEKCITRGIEVSVFGHDGDWQWQEEVMPLRNGGQLDGALVVLEDAR